MRRKTLLAAAVIAALALPIAGSVPASAHHTLCDNEPSDIWLPDYVEIEGVPIPAGADLNSPGAFYFCYHRSLVVVRTDGAGLTVCTFHTPNGDPTDDLCPIVI